MNFSIEGEYPVVRIKLNRGEKIVSSAGNMSWMTGGISYDAGTRGGILKGLARAFSGESMFQNTYTAEQDGEEIAFASSLPGKIIHIPMNGNELIAQKSAFLASDEGVNFDVVLTRKLSAGLLGGEGFLLQKFHGHGNLFLEGDGSLINYDLKPGEELLVDQGHVFMFETSVDYSIQTVKGLKNIFFGGEGAFLVKLRGPGRVVLQTMPIANLAARIIPFVPTSSN